MNTYKKLASDTVIYGMSSIVGRFLNWWLTPIYTEIFLPDVFGVVTNLYSYVAFLLVLLTYGLETGYFRFAAKSEDRQVVYSTSMISLLATSSVFILLIIVFRGSIASLIDYHGHNEYLLWLGLVVAIDALTSIPFAKLRLENRPIKFAFMKMVNILLNIGFNLFFLILCPYLAKHYPGIPVSAVYSPEIGVGYVFISNLLANLVLLVMMAPDIFRISYQFDWKLLRRLLGYSFPILIIGLAGMVNQNIDKILIPFLVPENQNPMFQLGVYGANYKIAVLMNMFIQAFRYAFEPFFFSRGKAKDDKEVHAVIMTYFVIFGLFIFLGVMLYIDIVKEVALSEEYYQGVKVVPLILMSNLFLGIYYALSVWYKLDDKTRYGAYIALAGSVITIGLNFWLVPIMGYMGSAVAVFVCFFVMMAISYLLAKKYYPIPYDLKSISLYSAVAIALYLVSLQFGSFPPYVKYGLNTLLLVFFAAVVYFKEKDRIIRMLNLKKR